MTVFYRHLDTPEIVAIYGNRTWTALFWSADRRDRVQGDGPTGVTDYHYGQVTK